MVSHSHHLSVIKFSMHNRLINIANRSIGINNEKNDIDISVMDDHQSSNSGAT